MQNPCTSFMAAAYHVSKHVIACSMLRLKMTHTRGLTTCHSVQSFSQKWCLQKSSGGSTDPVACSPQHQVADACLNALHRTWHLERLLPDPCQSMPDRFVIQESQARGRHLLADAPFAAGSLILSLPPLSAVLYDDQLSLRCSLTFAVPRKLLRCARCDSVPL